MKIASTSVHEAKREPDCGLNCSCFFSPHLSLCRAERPPHLKLNEGGVVPVHYNDIQAPFIQPLSNGLWTANAPPSGGRSPLITPPIPTRSPHNSPNKRERRVGPSCASCGPWTFEVRWENIPVHLNYIKERAAVEFNAELSPKPFQNKYVGC